MATKIMILSVIYLYFIYCVDSSEADVLESDGLKGDINSWCETTPHPEPCKYFLSQGEQYFRPNNSVDFRRMLVQVALEKALQEQSCTENLQNQCHSKRRKLAWLDCSTLFQNTIYQLNQTVEALKTNTSSSFFDSDAQTWLSAALTNIEICRSGSVELNVTQFIAPLVSNNVSELISNSLAINGALSIDDRQQESDKHEDFPSWVTKRDRKLLQKTSWTSRANVIVAKDGSGKFKSIQSAINYAAKVRKGNDRFIIYVKRGVYRENIAIGHALSKIMLVGEGLRYTIITGSRSVFAGFTTYSSATVGKVTLFLKFTLSIYYAWFKNLT